MSDEEDPREEIEKRGVELWHQMKHQLRNSDHPLSYIHYAALMVGFASGFFDEELDDIMAVIKETVENIQNRPAFKVFREGVSLTDGTNSKGGDA